MQLFSFKHVLYDQWVLVCWLTYSIQLTCYNSIQLLADITLKLAYTIQIIRWQLKYGTPVGQQSNIVILYNWHVRQLGVQQSTDLRGVCG